MIITFQDSHSPLHDRACRTVFVRVVLLIAVALFPSAALGQKAEESKSENIGPWEIEAIYKADFAQTQMQSYARQAQELGGLMAEAMPSSKPKG